MIGTGSIQAAGGDEEEEALNWFGGLGRAEGPNGCC